MFEVQQAQVCEDASHVKGLLIMLANSMQYLRTMIMLEMWGLAVTLSSE